MSKSTGAAVAQAASTVLITLAAGQFLMTLDSSVMNDAIATVAEDVGTTITGIQTAITLYTLVMAMLMISGGKIGSMIGRRRAFMIGCVIYGMGSLTTALAPNLPVLVLGWSVLEGIGAALFLPAIVALVAGNFPPQGRPQAYGLVMGAGAVAVAVGPLIGGAATTYVAWRRVFAGEVVLVLGDPGPCRRVNDAPPEGRCGWMSPPDDRRAGHVPCRVPGAGRPGRARRGRGRQLIGETSCLDCFAASPAPPWSPAPLPRSATASRAGRRSAGSNRV